MNKNKDPLQTETSDSSESTTEPSLSAKPLNLPKEDPTDTLLTPMIPDKIESAEDAKDAAAAIGQMNLSELKAELKNQILDELKDDQTKALEQAKLRRERETLEQQRYVTKMKESPDPWVDIVGWVRSSEGVAIELEWNDAFVDFLRLEGLTGTDDDALVQKWVALLMRDMAEQMEEENTESSEFAG